MDNKELKEILDNVIKSASNCVIRRTGENTNHNIWESACLMDAITKLVSVRASIDSHEEPTVTTWEFGTVTMQEYVKKVPGMIQHMIDKRLENHVEISSSQEIE